MQIVNNQNAVAGSEIKHSSMTHRHLPLWDKVIFVDWNGVLSRDPFWISILKKSSHPLFRSLSDSVGQLFKNNDDLVRSWMRGELKASEVIATLNVHLDKRFNHDYLSRALEKDCGLMRTNAALFNLLKKVQKSSFVILATDNMDCFVEHIRRVKNRRAANSELGDSFETETLLLSRTVRLFDDVLCSSDLGVLKREDPARFFGEWLSEHSFTFKDALLLDDLEINCSIFRSKGGAAIQVTYESLYRELDSVESKIEAWLLGNHI